MNNTPASIHCDDRLDALIQQGIDIYLVSSMMGEQYQKLPHARIFSLSPSGLRYELRHVLRRKTSSQFAYFIVFFIFYSVLWPFYLLEFLITRNPFLQLNLSWSWAISGGCMAAWQAWKNNADLIYSTGGSVSSQSAGWIASKITGKPWISEMQDPLTHQYNKKRPAELKFNLWAERKIAEQSKAMIFLTQGAAAASKLRNPAYAQKITVLRPGLKAFKSTPVPSRIESLSFMHLGTLDGTRNLHGFFEGANALLEKDDSFWRLDLYGHIGKVVHTQIERFNRPDRVTWHGKKSREESLELMNTGAVLLLIQNASDESRETIPSKVYEYLQANRLILGLIYKNEELSELLRSHGHLVAEVDEPQQIEHALTEVIERYRQERLHEGLKPYLYTVEESVNYLLRF